jgi:hypothetical protein
VAIAIFAFGSAPAGAAPTVPDAPTITSATTAVQGATITFRKPASDGGSRLFDYRVRCTSTDGGLTTLRSVRHSPITVHGMSVGKTYTCTVAARNAIGLGPASEPSDAVVPLPQPSKPLPGPATVTHVIAGVGRIQVSIAAPRVPHGGLPINGFFAKCRSTDGGVTHRERRQNSKVVVRHLTPGKTYVCSGAARNMLGYGTFGAPSEPVVVLFPPVPPDAPAVTSITAIVQGITIAFTKPAANGGAPVLGYRVQCTSSDGGATEVARQRRSPITVHGMSVGKTYTCAVAGRNSAGVGAFSDPSDPVVPLPR